MEIEELEYNILCTRLALEALEEVILSKNSRVGFNYYNSGVSKAFHQLVTKRYIGNVLIAYEYKGYLIDVRATRYDCEYELVNLGKI